MNQPPDPTTGMLLCEKAPTLNDLADAGATCVVGRGGFGGDRWNCGTAGHRSRDCTEPKKEGKGGGTSGEEAQAFGALNFEGEGN